MHSPQTLRRGKRWRSISATDQPARASRIAAAGAGRAGADDRDVEARRSSIASRRRAAQKQWRERGRRRIRRGARRSAARPGRAGGAPPGSLAPTKPARTLSTPSRARHRVGAEEEDQVAGAEREAAAPRLARGERIGAARAAGEQAARARRRRSDGGTGWRRPRPSARPSRGRRPSRARRRSTRPRLPAGGGVGGDRRGVDDRLAVEQVELDARASGRRAGARPRASAGRRRSRARGCAAAADAGRLVGRSTARAERAREDAGARP